jgi:hypothetical protein
MGTKREEQRCLFARLLNRKSDLEVEGYDQCRAAISGLPM